MTDLNKERSEFESDLADHLIERDSNGFYLNDEIQNYWEKHLLKVQIKELKAELEKAKTQAVPVWVSTEFMKPNDHDYVDILINGKRRIVDAVYLDGKFFIFPPFSKEQWTEVNNNVTHWMPRIEVGESGAEG